MKKMLTNNISLKLLAVLFAIIFWLIVVNIDDPDVTRTFHGIPVTVLDEEVITGNNQVYNIYSGKEVSISVTGPRSEVDKMNKDFFIAEAPFSEMSKVEAVPIYVRFRNSRYDKNCEITQKTMTMKLNIENIVTMSYEISINHTGELTSQYYLGKEGIEPMAVKVSAPESIINQISKVVVDIDLSSHTSDFSLPLNLKYYTETGSAVNLSSNVTTDISTVTYDAKLYQVREIPIEFNSVGTVADGYQLTEITGLKSTLRVAGPNADQLSSIIFPDELINVSGATQNVTVDVDVNALLPSGVYLCSEDDKSMQVTAKIEKLVTQTYSLPVSEIEKNNIPNGYHVQIADTEVNIKVTGLQRYHDSFSVNQLNAYVDLKNIIEGENEVLVRFTLPEGLKKAEDIRLKVVLIKDNEETVNQQNTESVANQEQTN